jgi:hypothetical protein
MGREGVTRLDSQEDPMQIGDTVMARNLMDGPTVMASDPKGTHEVRWEGKGDPSGGDIQYIPEEMLRIPAFAKALHQGIIAIANPEDNPEIVEALDKQARRFHDHHARIKEETMATIEPEKSRDLVSMECIGPSTKRKGICGEAVPVTETKKYDAAPLCHRHEHLRSEFVPVHTGQDERENKKVEWVRGTMSPEPVGLQV